jgi:hypothetical protein
VSTKQSLIIGLSVVLGCLMLGLSFGNLAAGQVASPPPGAARYQMLIKPVDSSTTVFVLDTHTGKCSYKETVRAENGWTDFGSPLESQKK